MLANESNSTLRDALDELSRLRRFTGPPAQFWPAFMAAAGNLIGACRGLLILRDPTQPDRLKKLSDWSSNGHADRVIVAFTRLVAEIAQRCAEERTFLRALENASAPGRQHYALALTIPLTGATEACIAAFVLLEATEDQAREALARLELAADTPNTYRLNQTISQAKTDVEKFASVLDVMVLVNAEKRFYAASLAFGNALATHFHCDRVSLGWLEHGYIRLRTISRTERFDRNMAAVKDLEVAMEEAFDQDEEVLWPPPENASLITKDHGQFARQHASGHVCSLPVRVDSKSVAVVTCERQAKPFLETELRQLRLACDQAARRLSELKQHDRWFGARWATAAKERLAKAVGPEHTWAKILALVGVAALILLLLPIYPYRVEGNFVVRSDDVSYLTAPFDGYIRAVPVRPGDPVQAGATLMTLDTADLELEEAAASSTSTATCANQGALERKMSASPSHRPSRK
ncbi:MAG: GAF domain-containing protein [Verrucomicrobiota bacterium]